MQEGVPELGSLFQHRIDLFFEIGLILGEFVVVINVLHHPGISSWRPTPIVIPAWSSPAKWCRLSVDQPTIFLSVFGFDTCVFLGSDTAIIAHVINVIDHWLGSFSKVAHVSWPIVHLQIDIEVVVSVPRWIVYSVPDSLEVGRKSFCPITRRTDE